MTTKKASLLVAAIALATPLIMTAPAAAANPIATSEPESSATIPVADLDLVSPPRVAELKDRVRGAAANLCLTNDLELPGMRLARAKCFRAAVLSGQRQLNRMIAGGGGMSTNEVTAILAETGR